jgi:dipeptidyl-peptidase 4
VDLERPDDLIQLGKVKNCDNNNLNQDLPDQSLMYASFSPTSDKIGFVCQNDLYVYLLQPEGHEEKEEANPSEFNSPLIRLTTSGSPTLFNGVGDWVYEEELELGCTFLWSPDGQHIAFWEIDNSSLNSLFKFSVLI